MFLKAIGPSSQKTRHGKGRERRGSEEKGNEGKRGPQGTHRRFGAGEGLATVKGGPLLAISPVNYLAVDVSGPTFSMPTFTLMFHAMLMFVRPPEAGETQHEQNIFPSLVPQRSEN